MTEGICRERVKAGADAWYGRRTGGNGEEWDLRRKCGLSLGLCWCVLDTKPSASGSILTIDVSLARAFDIDRGMTNIDRWSCIHSRCG